jgi:hypothetical protein
MDIFKDILMRLLGDISILNYIVLSIFILIGIMASIRIDASKRNRLSPDTPFNFNFRFLFLDNIKRLLKSFLTIFLIIRFGEDITGKMLTDWGAVLVGVCFDQIGEMINAKLKQFRDTIRDKFKES